MKIADALRAGRLLATIARRSGVVTPAAARGVLALARDPGALAAGPTKVVALHARADGARLALAGDGERLDYAAFDVRLNQIASALAGLGVRAGDRVALLLQNRPAGIAIPWAASRLGAIVVPLSWRARPAELAHAFEHSAAKLVIHEAALADVVAEGARGLASPPRTLALGPELDHRIAAGDPHPPRAAGAGAGGLIVYTSGTTGRPKGARRSLGTALFAPLLELVARVGFTRDDRQLVVCPLYHSAPPAIASITLGLGGAVHVAASADPEEILTTIARERITGMFVVPTLLARILALPEGMRARHDTRSLRWILSGAAPLPTDVARRTEAAFGPILWNFYGATETGLVTLAGPGEHGARPGTIGRALAGVDVRLLDDRGHDVAPGEIGALAVKSHMLADGYHADDDATRAATTAGYFTVGDLARRDADGFLYLAGRAHDLVISGGVNVYPLEIENRLHEHPDVFEAAVVGVPDPDWGEALHAFVVVRPGHEAPDPDALRAFCRETLASYKVPKRVSFLDALPRNPTGKVLKRELADRT